MNIIRGTAATLFVVTAILASASQSDAQLDRIRRAAETARGAIGNTGTPPQDQAQTEAPPAPAAEAPRSAAADPGEGVWLNYDFVPGSRPLFVDDFARDRVGDFPRRLEFVEGNMEIAEWREARFLRVTSRPGRFVIQLPEQLPERFTVEFDATPGYPNAYIVFRFADDATEDVRFRGFAGKAQGGVWGQRRQALGETQSAVGPMDVFRGRIMADGRYVKVYVNETRVANIPNAGIGRSNRIVLEVPGDAENPAFFGNLSVMAGGLELYDALASDGRVATQGILFATGSDRLRPESTPTLTEITNVMRENPQLRLMIEGHTDNEGQAAGNQTLSASRAAAVKAYLVQQGIDAARLESTGLGDTRPSAPNDTPEGRQQNRRVELVRL